MRDSIQVDEREVHIPIERGTTLEGNLTLPREANGLVLFAHGSGSSRHSPRNRSVARALQQAELGTLLVDLLTREEEEAERDTRHLRFDIGLLAGRLERVGEWLSRQPDAAHLPLGLFGASTGAAAALVAAARAPDRIQAVVSRGGRPDLAGQLLPRVRAPTLLIVGGEDRGVIELNEQAFDALGSPKELEVVPGATHLFEEPGTLEQVAQLAAGWFTRHLARVNPAFEPSDPGVWP
jgi:putative phosphoribosyl transferase